MSPYMQPAPVVAPAALLVAAAALPGCVADSHTPLAVSAGLLCCAAPPPPDPPVSATTSSMPAPSGSACSKTIVCVSPRSAPCTVRDNRSGLQIHCMLGLVRQVRPPVLHSGNPRIRIMRVLPNTVRSFARALAVQFGQIFPPGRLNPGGFRQSARCSALQA